MSRTLQLEGSYNSIYQLYRHSDNSTEIKYAVPYERVILYGVIKRRCTCSLFRGKRHHNLIRVSRSFRSCYEDTKDARKRHLAAR